MNSTANTPPETYLEINSLSKSFGSFHALNDISLTVKDGDFVCFLGPSNVFAFLQHGLLQVLALLFRFSQR